MIPQELAVLYDNPADSADPLDRRELALKVLATISSLMVKPSGQRRMLSEVLRQLQRSLGMMRCTVQLVSPDAAELVVEAARSANQGDFGEPRHRLGEGIISAVVKAGAVPAGPSATVPERGREPRFRSRIYQSGAGQTRETACLCVSIVLDSEVVGTLSADIPQQSGWPLEDHTCVLEIVASLIAFDVKARRLAASQRHTLELENGRLRSAVRELENRVQEVARVAGDEASHRHDPLAARQVPVLSPQLPPASLTSQVELLEKRVISEALESTRGNVAAAARLLNITPRIIRYKMKNLGLDNRRMDGRRE